MMKIIGYYLFLVGLVVIGGFIGYFCNNYHNDDQNLLNMSGENFIIKTYTYDYGTKIFVLIDKDTNKAIGITAK